MNLIMSKGFVLNKIIFFIFLAIGLLGNLNNAYCDKINFQSIPDGLSNQNVKCISKDYKGFMWFGTNEGLNRFDGSNFITYEKRVNDTTSLRSNSVNAILEDSNHNLWIGTSLGLCLYNREKDNFYRFKHFRPDHTAYITSLFEDSNKNIWIGTSGAGLFIYDTATDSLFAYTQEIDNSSSLSSNFISSIVADKKNRIWVGTREGLDLFDVKRNTFLHFDDIHQMNSDLDNDVNIKKLILDDNGAIWIGTYGRGLFKVTEEGEKWIIKQYLATGRTEDLSSNDILSLICDQKGDIWIGTENGGLNRLAVNSDKFDVYKTHDGNYHGISSNSIWSLFQDNSGIIWIGTYNHGFNFIDQRIEKFDVFQKNPFDQKTLVNNNVLNLRRKYLDCNRWGRGKLPSIKNGYFF